MKIRLVLPVAALALVAAMALAAACGGGNSTRSSSTQAPTANVTLAATPLYGWKSVIVGSIAENAQEAVGFAREEYFACPPYCAQFNGSIASMQYVETTVGQLRALFGRPAVDRLNAFDEWAAWAIVAHGTFSGWYMGAATHVYPVGSNFWVFVLKDRNGMATYATDEDHDIKRLGRPHDVPLPLPDWPTPVNLTPIEG